MVQWYDETNTVDGNGQPVRRLNETVLWASATLGYTDMATTIIEPDREGVGERNTLSV